MSDTKEVMGYFGKTKQITRDDYVKQWVNHANDLTSLANTAAEYDELKAISERIEILAGKAWDRIK